MTQAERRSEARCRRASEQHLASSPPSRQIGISRPASTALPRPVANSSATAPNTTPARAPATTSATKTRPRRGVARRVGQIVPSRRAAAQTDGCPGHPLTPGQGHVPHAAGTRDHDAEDPHGSPTRSTDGSRPPRSDPATRLPDRLTNQSGFGRPEIARAHNPGSDRHDRSARPPHGETLFVVTAQAQADHSSRVSTTQPERLCRQTGWVVSVTRGGRGGT
jgi:hypothetical protein